MKCKYCGGELTLTKDDANNQIKYCDYCMCFFYVGDQKPSPWSSTMPPKPQPTKNEIVQRPSWPETWMSFAIAVSRRSVDTRLKVGTVIVSEDNSSVLALGYNGDERGGSNTPASLEPGKSEFLHSEINALLKCDYNFHKRKHMYVTHFPCRMCCKAIVNAGIHRVVYDDVYRDMSGKEILVRSGVELYNIEELARAR